MHLSEVLWQRHLEVAPFPPGVVPVPAMIRGTAFFPGGRGLWQWDSATPLPEFPTGGVMVLGHDFHSESGYVASLKRGAESRAQPTWRNFHAVLEEVGIDPLRCFFTNVYMGLRAGQASTGRFPGAADAPFVARCLRFLQVQLEVCRPGVILTLGRFVPSLLARLSPDLHEWRSVSRLMDLDDRSPVRPAVKFDVGEGAVVSAVAALTHPSQRQLSVGRRRYRGVEGHEAELAMISDACAAASRLPD